MTIPHKQNVVAYLDEIDPAASKIGAVNTIKFLENGKTTKPKPVPESPYWVITNTNTGRKRLIIEQLMQAMGYSAEITAEVCNKV